jgi:hypothetical protein
MTSPSHVWLFPSCWALAVVVAAFKLLFDVLAADARNAKLPAGSLLATVRTFVHCGVMATSTLVVGAIAKAIDEIWDLSLEPLSYDLAADGESVKRVVLGAGVFICLAMMNKRVERLLDRLLPNAPANRSPAVESPSERGLANGR